MAKKDRNILEYIPPAPEGYYLWGHKVYYKNNLLNKSKFVAKFADPYDAVYFKNLKNKGLENA